MSEENYEFENDMEKEIEPKNKSGFSKGVFFGMVIMLLVVSVTGLLLITALRKNGYEITNVKVDKNLTAGILSEQVEGKVAEILNALSTYYYDDVDSSVLAEGMFRGMVDSLGDKYTTYFNKQEYEDFMLSTTGIYYGIGALLAQDKNTNIITIEKVYANSPAEESGLMEGDIILSANGVSSEGISVSELVNYIRGEEGTDVTLSIKRGDKTLEITCTRRRVDVPTIEYTMFDNNIGYIMISQFEEVTAQQFKDALKDLKNQGMKALVIDLRGNPGGLLSSVSEILDEILPEGLLVYTENKYGHKEEYTSKKGELGLPLCVLVNESSASASEIFAGAIKDYEYGTLIGTNTFGKGIVQVIVPLKDGSAIKVTTSRYYTPKGNYIHGVGIAPDIELPYKFLGGENDKYEYRFDNQLQRALEILGEKINE
ncbi:MAG: S41 family peptidase [Lachnospiraceae bacterium]|nr:S41 family peptidase [Lachnospiraceae bacterium]